MRVADLDRARAFYTGVLGLEPHPEKDNWLGSGQGCPIHLMERTRQGDDVHDPARHAALRVERLEDVVRLLIDNGCEPFQSDANQNNHRPIASAEQPLDFGTGTVFVCDPDGNLIEFVERRRGIFADHDPAPF